MKARGVGSILSAGGTRAALSTVLLFLAGGCVEMPPGPLPPDYLAAIEIEVETRHGEWGHPVSFEARLRGPGWVETDRGAVEGRETGLGETWGRYGYRHFQGQMGDFYVSIAASACPENGENKVAEGTWTFHSGTGLYAFKEGSGTFVVISDGNGRLNENLCGCCQRIVY